MSTPGTISKAVRWFFPVSTGTSGHNDVFMVMENIHIRSDNNIGILSIVSFYRGGRFWQTRTDL